MQGKTEVQQQEGLTARQIFDKILKGQVVRIGPDPEVAQQLKAHLNVLKSRHKKLFKSLGLDFCASVISVQSCWNPGKTMYGIIHLLDIPADYYEIKLVAPKQRKTYAVFSVQEEESNQDEQAPNPI